jgi:hypothetical protein
MKRLIAIAAIWLWPAIAAASDSGHNTALRSAAMFGVSPSEADNTALLQRAIDWAEDNYAHIYLPDHIKIAGTLLIQKALGQRGFGLEGPGIIEETSNNLPIIKFVGIHNSQQAVDLHDLNLKYTNMQTKSQPNSYCILFEGDNAMSVYNGTFSRIQCTNAYRGFGQKGRYNIWGNRWTSIDCKANAGMCLDFRESTGSQPNNYFGNVYAHPQSVCADTWEFAFERQSTLTLENIETNNTNCGLLFMQVARVVEIKNIRFEVGTIGPELAYQGLITVSGVGVHIDGYEVQTLTVNVGAGKAFFLFSDTGANGPPDRIENAVLWNEAKSHSGDLYGVRSTQVRVLMEPIYDWLSGRPFASNVFPYDTSVHNVVDITQR